MILYPAIDLKDGKCIRLKKGELKQITFYNNNAICIGCASKFKDEYRLCIFIKRKLSI